MNWSPKLRLLSSREDLLSVCARSATTLGPKLNLAVPLSHFSPQHLRRPPPSWEAVGEGRLNCYLFLIVFFSITIYSPYTPLSPHPLNCSLLLPTLLVLGFEAIPLALLCLLYKMRLILTFTRLLWGSQTTTEVHDWHMRRAQLDTHLLTSSGPAQGSKGPAFLSSGLPPIPTTTERPEVKQHNTDALLFTKRGNPTPGVRPGTQK